MISQKEKNKLIEFIYSREKLEGGFSFAKTTPQTLEDTYYALRLLKELKVAYSNKKTLSYIKNFNFKKNVSLKQLYQLVYLYDMFEFSEQKHDVKIHIVSRSFNGKTISEIYYMSMIKNILNMEIILSQEAVNFLSYMSLKKLKDISECEKYLALANRFRIPFRKQDFLLWIKDAQNPDGCFGFFPKTTSFLENTYYALRALEELHSTSYDIKNCKRFIHSCLTNTGGFGRQATTVPSLQYSYYAILSLKIIDKM